MSITELKGYEEFLRNLKVRIRSAQVRAALAVNSELVLLYWQIGRDILTRQEQEGWGAKVVERLAADRCREFPDMKGFSRANLMYMRSFAEAEIQRKLSNSSLDKYRGGPPLASYSAKTATDFC